MTHNREVAGLSPQSSVRAEQRPLKGRIGIELLLAMLAVLAAGSVLWRALLV